MEALQEEVKRLRGLFKLLGIDPDAKVGDVPCWVSGEIATFYYTASADIAHIGKKYVAVFDDSITPDTEVDCEDDEVEEDE